MAQGKKEEVQRPVAKAVESFIWEIDALADTLPLVTALLENSRKAEEEKWNTFLKTRCVPSEDEKSFNVPAEVHPEFLNVRRKFQRSRRAIQIIPRSFLTSLVSHFDALIGSLVHALFYLRPEVLNSSERKLSFRELTGFNSIEVAREFIVEKEVEALLRDSH